MNTLGLLPLSEKDKELNAPYAVGAFMTLPPLSEVPEDHVVSIPDEWVLNQTEFDPYNDECAGASSSVACSILDGERVDPHFVWMMARTKAGYDVPAFGCTNKDIALAYVKVGALKFEDSPYSFKDGRNIVADITKWDVAKLLPKAIERRKSPGIFWVNPTQGYDAWDTWRAAVTKLDKMYGKKHTCVFGLMWAYNTTNIEKPVTNGSGHDTLLLGWKSGKGVLLNSQGLYVGEKGRYWLNREVFNFWAEKFGAFIMVDESPENIKWMLENGVKLDDNWIVSLIKPFSRLVAELYARLKKISVV